MSHSTADNKKQFLLKEYLSLRPYFSQYKSQYILGFLCLIIVDASQIAIPQFIRLAIDLLSAGTFELKQIIMLCLYMVFTMGLVAAGRFLWRYFLGGTARKIEADLRKRLFDHLQILSQDFYQKNKIGDLMARSINDLGAVRRSLGMGLVALFDAVFMSTAILIIIFVQDAESARLSIIPLPVITILILFFGSKVGKKFRAAHEAYSRLSDDAQETFAGISVIKSFVKEWWAIKKFSKSNDEYRKANMGVVRLFGFFFPLITFLSGLTVLVMLYIGGMRVITGEMTPGSLVAMFRYLSMLIWPLMGAGFTVNMIQRGSVSLGRVNEILNTEPSIRDKGAGSREQGREEKRAENREQRAEICIEVRNLCFGYKEGVNVLGNVSFSVKDGEWLGIMGRTGAGKSTLIKTFTRMIDPPAGTVKVFGVDVKDWPLKDLRGLFAVSPQDSYLFSDSIANNIAYGLEEKNEQAVDKAINFACLNKDLSLFQHGKDTLIGERGLTLSGGQKQRTAIARAAIMESPILVLDDSLSAVDNETELKILEELRSSRQNRTTIIISHRVSTLKYADKILVLDNGKVLEYGSPKEMTNTGGFYNKMAALQRLENTEGRF